MVNKIGIWEVGFGQHDWDRQTVQVRATTARSAISEGAKFAKRYLGCSERTLTSLRLIAEVDE